MRSALKRFVPYLVKLPVPLVPLEKIPVPALHLPKLHKELFRHFQLVGFALPVLKADKIPFAAFRGFLPKRVCLNPVCHPVVLLITHLYKFSYNEIIYKYLITRERVC